MKGTLSLAVLFTALLFSGGSYAQNVVRPDGGVPKVKDSLIKVSVGIKAGAIFNQVNGDLTYKKGYTPGIIAGGFAESSRKKWGIQAEALFNSARYNLLDGPAQSNAWFSIIYVNIIVMPEFEVVPHLWLQAGVEFSTFVSLSEHPADTVDPKNYFQPRNFSALAGLEYRLPGNFTVGARYVTGLSNIKSDFISYTSQSSQEWRTNSALVYIGYRFDNKKSAK